MIIGGFQKFSLIDYPGNLSAVIFTRGCNFRCPFCHNPELVLPDHYSQTIPEEEIFAVLKKRTQQLDGIVVTGGEPTIHDDLGVFLSIIKELGYLIKLDTNGTRPGIIQKLATAGLVDFFAMDIKAPLDKYKLLTATKVDTDAIQQSIDIIRNSGIQYQFRTTMVKGMLDFPDLINIRNLVGRQSPYVVQHFNPTEKIVQPDLLEQPHYTTTEIEHFSQNLQQDDSVLAV